MNKLTRKLFRYFAILETVFALIVFLGFCGVFHFYTVSLHQKELKERAETIASKMEAFMETDVPQSGRGAYLKFLDDISMADAYLISADGQPFFFGQHKNYIKEPTKEVSDFANQVFVAQEFVQKQGQDDSGSLVTYVGMPVWKESTIVGAVVIADGNAVDGESFVQAAAILGVCLLVTLLVSFSASRYLSGRFMDPIRKIADTIKELADGNYNAKTDIRDKTELGQLAMETDQLAEKLEDTRLENQRLVQLQKDYFADISHELRTPVTVIRSSLEAICDGVVRGEKAEEYQRQMLEESISLQRLVNDMLELSRLQNQDFPIEKQEMDILMALEDAVRAVRVISGKKQIQIIYEKTENEWMVNGDYGRLRQMFIAALDNVIKYSDMGQNVLINAQKEDSTLLRISIQDHGCGIPQEELENIFRKFYRSSVSKEKGSGLGLAIIKSIGERHGIEVALSSTCGKGTEISFLVSVAGEENRNVEFL